MHRNHTVYYTNNKYTESCTCPVSMGIISRFTHHISDRRQYAAVCYLKSYISSHGRKMVCVYDITTAI